MDLIGQIHLPYTKEHKYILVAVDYFTKWVKAIALKNVEQNDIIDFIEERIIHRSGIPETTITNNGTVFTSRNMVQCAETRNVKLLTSTSYYA